MNQSGVNQTKILNKLHTRNKTGISINKKIEVKKLVFLLIDCGSFEKIPNQPETVNQSVLRSVFIQGYLIRKLGGVYLREWATGGIGL